MPTLKPGPGAAPRVGRHLRHHVPMAAPTPPGRHPLSHENVGVVGALGQGVEADHRAARRRLRSRRRRATPRADELPRQRPCKCVAPPCAAASLTFSRTQPGTLLLKTALPAAVAGAEPAVVAVGVHGAMRAGLQLQRRRPGRRRDRAADAGGRPGQRRRPAASSSAGRPGGWRGAGGGCGCYDRPRRRARRGRADAPRAGRQRRAARGRRSCSKCAKLPAGDPQAPGFVRRGGASHVEHGPHFASMFGSLELNPNQQLMRKNLRLEAVWGYGGPDYFARAQSRSSSATSTPSPTWSTRSWCSAARRRGLRGALDGGYRPAGAT